MRKKDKGRKGQGQGKRKKGGKIGGKKTETNKQRKERKTKKEKKRQKSLTKETISSRKSTS